MLTAQEEEFLKYWKKNRASEKRSFRQLLIGLPVGFLISGGIILSLNLDWYTRANMVANSSLNPVVFLIAILAITCFTAIFYKKYRWEMKEQRYKELLHRKEAEKKLQNNDAAL